MKILYAAGNHLSSKFQLLRFVNNLQNHDLKIAAFKKSSPLNLSIDWTLDCLIDPFRPKNFDFSNTENYSIYYQMVKSYNPDLIISDLEIYTSNIAIELSLPIIQCSSNLLSFGLKTFDFGISTQYKFIYEDYNLNHIIENIINNSDDNYIYSHFGDLDYSPKIKDNFKWISPYHEVGKKSVLCEHEIVGITPSYDLKIVNEVVKNEDGVIFTSHTGYDNIKDLNNQNEYFCNLRNAKQVLVEANPTFLADAFYNQQNPIFSINYFEKDSVLNGQASQYFKLGRNILDPQTKYETHLGIRKNLFIHEIL